MDIYPTWDTPLLFHLPTLLFSRLLYFWISLPINQGRFFMEKFLIVCLKKYGIALIQFNAMIFVRIYNYNM